VLRLRQPLLVLGLSTAICVCMVLHKPAGNDLCLHKCKVSDKAVNVLLHPTFSILHTSLYGTDRDFIVCGRSPFFCMFSSKRNCLCNAK